MNKKLSILAFLISVGLGMLLYLIPMLVFQPEFHADWNIPSMGTLKGAVVGVNTSGSPTQPIGGISNLIPTIMVLLAIAHTVIGLLKWHSWRTKYGKSRTPIVMPVKSKN